VVRQGFNRSEVIRYGEIIVAIVKDHRNRSAAGQPVAARYDVFKGGKDSSRRRRA
jgi:hypothetical protein